MVAMKYYGTTRILKSNGDLKYGNDIVALKIPNLLVIPATEYYIIEKGYQAPKPSNKVISDSISNILGSWNIDTSTNQPQYLTNPLYLLEQTALNGTIIKNNGITIAVRKSYQHNNVRILLHGGTSSASDPLFWVDIDEENK